MLNYTKGEWHLQSNGLEHLKVGDISIAKIHGPDSSIPAEQFLANGLLLSAASDMYEILNELIKTPTIVGPMQLGVFIKIKNVIAKAEGK